MERKRCGEEDNSRIDNLSRRWIWQTFGLVLRIGIEAYRVMFLCTTNRTYQLATLSQQVSSKEEFSTISILPHQYLRSRHYDVADRRAAIRCALLVVT